MLDSKQHIFMLVLYLQKESRHGEERGKSSPCFFPDKLKWNKKLHFLSQKANGHSEIACYVGIMSICVD